MNFFYQAGAMGYHGEGYLWHKLFGFKFPEFPITSKTITLKKKRGIPFAILKFGDTVWNRNGLHNPGFNTWCWDHNRDNDGVDILSLHGTDDEIQYMCDEIKGYDNLRGIELNYSCPNVSSGKNKRIPNTRFPLYLKLNCKQDPYYYDLNEIRRIHLNSVPKYFGGVSGEAARKENWAFIRKFINEGLNVAGCSFNKKEHISYMKECLGCTYIGIGSVMITNPRLVTQLMRT